MSPISNINTRYLNITAISLLSPLFLFAQSLTGLWTGAMSNDSATVRKDQSFEIALTEYKGKVFGYSCSEFIVNDTLFYIVKRVKGTIEGDICEVTDDEIIAYNFRGKLDKGVKVTSTFRRNNSDSTWYLDGTWKTNVTKKYYAVTGTVGLKEEKDMAMSKLFPHLEELNLANSVAFYKEKKEDPFTVRVAKPEKIVSEYTDKPSSLPIEDISIVPAKPDLQKAEPETASAYIIKRGEALDRTDKKNIDPASVTLVPSSVNKTVSEQQQGVPSINKQPDIDLAKTETKNISSSSVAVTPIAVNKTVTETKRPAGDPSTPASNPVVKNNNVKPATTTPVSKTIAKPEQPVVKNQTPPSKQPDPVISKPVTSTTAVNDPVAETKKPVVENRKTEAELIKPAAVIEGRKSEFTQVVNYGSDSLELALYDNGEIDGDTVSVFMNGEVLMARQGLKSSAIRKTIYISPGNEDFTLVLFAENLGKYPPNTGLLVIHDGKDVYNLRFSSDLQKSAGIVFRRKK